MSVSVSLFGHMGPSVMLKPTVHEPQSYTQFLREVHSNHVPEADVDSLDMSLLSRDCKVFHQLLIRNRSYLHLTFCAYVVN